MQINPTPKTPQVLFDFDSKSLLIKGISCPDNPLQFYTPLFENLKEFLKKSSQLAIEIQLDYFNTGSSKCILNLFQIITEVLKNTEEINVKWITDEGDSELEEAGKIFEEMSGLNFVYITATEEN